MSVNYGPEAVDSQRVWMSVPEAGSREREGTEEGKRRRMDGWRPEGRAL